MSGNKIFIEEVISARITEEHTNDVLKLKHEASTNKEIRPNEEIPEERMNMNEYLTPINETSENKEIKPTEEIPVRITEEQMNDCLKLNHKSSENKEVTPSEGFPARITIEHDRVIYEELDKNNADTPTDMKQVSVVLIFRQ